MCDEAPIDLISGGYDYSTDDLESFDLFKPTGFRVGGGMYNAKPMKAECMVNNKYVFSNFIIYV